MPELLIFAHGGPWERRFQATSLAASAAASGSEVGLALFFGALEAWVRGRWDDLDPTPPVVAKRLGSLEMPPLTEMLAPGRQEGRIRVYACSASARILGLDPGEVQARVDAILGWPSFWKMAGEAGRVVTL